jgi:hypothetical protein
MVHWRSKNCMFPGIIKCMLRRNQILISRISNSKKFTMSGDLFIKPFSLKDLSHISWSLRGYRRAHCPCLTIRHTFAHVRYSINLLKISKCFSRMHMSSHCFLASIGWRLNYISRWCLESIYYITSCSRARQRFRPLRPELFLSV